jgi:DNA-dependent RNA polymerase auxiliary subunit epsilon
MVTGTLWFAGKSAPVQLELRGNFLRDMAGCLLEFENPHPAEPDERANLDAMQVGMTGDMTASRKVTLYQHPESSRSGAGAAEREPVRRVANSLYLEWFSETNGRVVIESTDYRIEWSAPVWTMSAEQEERQMASNRESFREWLEHLSELEEMDVEPPVQAGEGPLNEFQWEKLLKDSDRKTERLGEVLEKYHGHPDSEKLIAREMGWTWVEEEIEAQERGVFTEAEDIVYDEQNLAFASEEDEDEDEDEIVHPRDPDPAREGIDWARDSDGTIEHPLALRALQFSASLWEDFETQNLLGETGDSRVFEWAGLVESAGVRLSNTLGDVAFGEDVEPGYVVAGLKRSVHLIHQALERLQAIEPLNLISADTARNAQRTLFALREDIIAMMRQWRDRPA